MVISPQSTVQKPSMGYSPEFVQSLKPTGNTVDYRLLAISKNLKTPQ